VIWPHATPGSELLPLVLHSGFCRAAKRVVRDHVSVNFWALNSQATKTHEPCAKLFLQAGQLLAKALCLRSLVKAAVLARANCLIAPAMPCGWS
jgi:hypothetical protein